MARGIAQSREARRVKACNRKKKEPTEAKPAKAPSIKPLGGFVLTKSGKLCTEEKIVSKWGSDNLKTWKRIYEVHTQELKPGQREARVFLRYVICLKNGQYYVSDPLGLGMVSELLRNTPYWDRFIHPAGAKKAAAAEKKIHRQYTFRDINEAFGFAEKYAPKRVNDRTKRANNYFQALIKDIYETEYEYAQYPNRRGKSYSQINWYEKPQKVDTKLKS